MNESDPSLINRRKLLSLAGQGLVVSVFGSLIGCGGSGGGDGGSGGGSGGGTGGSGGGGTPGRAVSEAERIASVTGIEAKAKELAGTGSRFNATQMLAYMKSQKVFTEVGYHQPSGTVWGTYTDGVLYAILNNVDYGPVTGREVDPEPKRRKPSKSRGREADYNMLVAEDQWRQLNLYDYLPLPLDYPHVTDPFVDRMQMVDLARSVQKLGMTVVGMDDFGNFRDDPLSVDQLKSVSGDGVFYYTGYGAWVDREEDPLSVLATSTPVISANKIDKGTQFDLDAKRLVILSCPFLGPEGLSDVVWSNRYGITKYFVDHYSWSFPSNSIVFLNAPYTALWENVFSTRGVNTFMAWEKSLPVRRQLAVGKDLMHLFIGTDWRNGTVTTIKDKPPLRNAGLREAVDYLYSEGFLNGADLFGGTASFFINSPRTRDIVNQMRPAIEYITVDETLEELQIQGQLGKSEFNKKIWFGGTVPTMDGNLETADGRMTGSDLPTNDWSSTIAKGSLRAHPGGGWVQIKDGNRWSNAVPLTAYKTKFHFVLTTADTLTIDVTVDVTFRGMMQGYRLRLNEDPLLMWSTLAMTNTMDMKASWTASGSASKTEGDRVTELTWSGNGLVTARTSGTTQSVTFATTVDLKTLRGTLLLAILDNAGFKETRKVTVNGTTSTTEMQVPVHVTSKAEWGNPAFGSPPLTFNTRDSSFQNGAGTYTITDYRRFDQGASITVTWIQEEMDTPPEEDRGQR